MTALKLIISKVSLFLAALTTLFQTGGNASLKQTTTQILASPLSIESMRQKEYPGSDVTFEQTLEPGENYQRYIVSFMSDGLKEYAYLTIPDRWMPYGGYPLILFNHGYQIPQLYTPEGNYIAYMDALAKAGYIVFKPDYRGNGKSKGLPTSAYFSPDYLTDDLNALASAKTLKDPETGKEIVNTKKIGIWGHSMGGSISLRAAEVSPDIKAVVIWGGVVGSYTDIIYNWETRVSYKPAAQDLHLRTLGLSSLLVSHGTPYDNPEYWDSVDPSANVDYITAPVQLHVGEKDNQVPNSFSQYLYDKLIYADKTAEIYTYPEANHDINQGFSLAMKRTISFFDRYLK